MLESLASVQMGTATPLALNHSTGTPFAIAAIAVGFITVDAIAVGTVLMDVALFKFGIFPILSRDRLTCSQDCSVNIVLPPLSLDLLVPVEHPCDPMVKPIGVLTIPNLDPGHLSLGLVTAVGGGWSCLSTTWEGKGWVASC